MSRHMYGCRLCPDVLPVVVVLLLILLLLLCLLHVVELFLSYLWFWTDLFCSEFLSSASVIMSLLDYLIYGGRLCQGVLICIGCLKINACGLWEGVSITINCVGYILLHVIHCHECCYENCYL